MLRFYRLVKQRGDQPLSIAELCREIGTSPTTLNACCHEYLGMGPRRYLLLRRMNLLRRDLQRATPSETTVTEIATRYGFWNFGRLAREYRKLFGEVPSATLERSGTIKK